MTDNPGDLNVSLASASLRQDPPEEPGLGEQAQHVPGAQQTVRQAGERVFVLGYLEEQEMDGLAAIRVGGSTASRMGLLYKASPWRPTKLQLFQPNPTVGPRAFAL